VLTIRKLLQVPFAPRDLVRLGSTGPLMVEFLAACAAPGYRNPRQAGARCLWDATFRPILPHTGEITGRPKGRVVIVTDARISASRRLMATPRRFQQRRRSRSAKGL
jgi:hypothetical protein